MERFRVLDDPSGGGQQPVPGHRAPAPRRASDPVDVAEGAAPDPQEVRDI
jgi:hypothetical protein